MIDLSLQRAKRLQSIVDKGQERWRLDPLEVARRDGRMAGFLLTDKFQLLSNPPSGIEAGSGGVEVLASHEGKEYIIQLTQPVKNGPSGIWLIGGIREKLTGQGLFPPDQPYSRARGMGWKAV